MAYFPSSWVTAGGEFAPSDPSDSFAIIDSRFERGGHHTGLLDTTERDAITADRRTFGMLASIIDGTTYQLQDASGAGVDSDVTNNLNWVLVNLSGGGGGTGFVPGFVDNARNLYAAGPGFFPTSLTTASSNIFVGNSSGQQITSGSHNVVVGDAAAISLTIGSANIFIGHDANTNTPGQSNSIAIGRSSVVDGDNTIAIGSSVVVSTAGEINIGLGSNGYTRFHTLGVDNDFSARSYVFGELSSVGEYYNLTLNGSAGTKQINLYHGGLSVMRVIDGSKGKIVQIGDPTFGNMGFCATVNDDDKYFSVADLAVSAQETQLHANGDLPYWTYGSGGGLTFSYPTNTPLFGDVLVASGSGFNECHWQAPSGGSPTVGTLNGNGWAAPGASIFADVLYMQTAIPEAPGLVSTTTQNFSGLKQFENSLLVGKSGQPGYLALIKRGAAGTGIAPGQIRFSHTSGDELEITYASNSHVNNFSALGSASFQYPNASGVFALQNTIGASGSAPAWVASALQIPLAGAGVTSGTISNAAQTIQGQKTLNGQTIFATPSTSGASVIFPAGTDPSGFVPGMMWHNVTQKSMFVYLAGTIQSLPGVLFTQTTGVTVVNTIAQSTVLTTGVGTKTLPLNFFTVGKMARLKGRGVYSAVVGVGAPTLTVRIKIGSVTLCTTVVSSLLTTGTDNTFDFECDITCRTIGASGSLMVDGVVGFDNGVMLRGFAPLGNAQAAQTFNTGVAGTIDVTAQWSAAAAGNTITMNQASIMILN